MSGKVDKDFVDFVKNKKKSGKKENKKQKIEESDNEEVDELDYEYLNTKRQSEPFNNVTSNKKMKIDDKEVSICDLLNKNKGKVIQEKKIKINK